MPIVHLLLPLLLLQLLITLTVASDTCKCLNRAICSSDNHCICPHNFIGQLCQIEAGPLQQQPVHTILSTNLSYFYFQPTQVNYYRLTFNICMLHNPLKLPSIFYIQTEKNNGGLRAVQSLFESAKLEIGDRGCASFSTHYISTKRRQDQSYRKIIVGLKVLQKDDPMHYLNVYKNQQHSTEHKEDQIQTAFIPELAYQRITIQMNYQTYTQNTYYANFIIITAASLLLIIFSAFVNYLCKRYRIELQGGFNDSQIEDLSHLRYYRRRNNPERQQRPRQKQIEWIDVFMPVTKYGQQSCFFESDLLTNCQKQLNKLGEVDSCSICLNDFQMQDDIRTTPCRHRYHRQCIDNWYVSNLSCPICRRKLDFRQQIRRIYYKFLRGLLTQ